MKFSEQWLREWVNPPISREELAQQLIQAGIEIDSLEPVSPPLTGLRIARILSANQHPNADRLRVCQIDAGDGQALQVICGAPNARAGINVVLATVGAELPGGLKIKKARIRDVESFGMLCSYRELGLSNDHEGIIELPADAPLGEDFYTYAQLDDYIFSLELTPNRGDCLSIRGLAREVAALSQIPFAEQPASPVNPMLTQQFPVSVEAEEACPRYLTRIISGFNIHKEVPTWLKRRLERSGIRSLHPVVDITNYVMLELGQPLHAFDFAKLKGHIRVRFAQNGESLQLLNQTQATLKDNTLVIADEKNILAIAGIMGGQDSAVTPDTHTILLESAYFASPAIAGRARQYGLTTDSSHRFERGIDPNSQALAIERATSLIISILGGQAGPIQSEEFTSYLPGQSEIYLDTKKLKRYLGFDVPISEVASIFHRLYCQVQLEADAHSLRVTPPAYRHDLRLDVDLIEEVVRILGYHNIPDVPVQEVDVHFEAAEETLEISMLRGTLVNLGYHEAITYSFVDPVLQKILYPDVEEIALANPIASDMSVMRFSLLPGLLTALKNNQARQQMRARLFEMGRIFISHGPGELEQTLVLGGILSDAVLPEQWSAPVRKVDFFDAKGDVETLIALTRVPQQFYFDKLTCSTSLHPGQAAEIRRGEHVVGWVGALHPHIIKKLDLQGPIYAFQIRLDALQYRQLPHFQPYSKFPANRRDLALIVERKITAQQLLDCVAECAPSILVHWFLFDVYEGEQMPTDKKSIGLSLILQDLEKTLTDLEIQMATDKVFAVLEEKLGAALRSG